MLQKYVLQRGACAAMLAGALLIPVLVTGCDNAASEQSAEPPVDPRFASAEAITAHFNELVAGGPDRLEHVCNMLYPENTYQQRVIRTLRHSVPLMIFMLEVEDHFGEPLFPDIPITRQADQLDDTVRLVTTEADRAEAVFVDERGDEGRFYFIKAEGRWWISGYTLEYAADRRIATPALDMMEELTELIAASTSKVRARFQAGQYQTVQELRSEFVGVIYERLDAHPNRFERVRLMFPPRDER